MNGSEQWQSKHNHVKYVLLKTAILVIYEARRICPKESSKCTMVSRILSKFGGRIVKPAISVIIPAYNVEKYIPKALKSLKNQTFKSIEVIVVNDGSTDNTRNVIINELAGANFDWKLIDQENKGVSVARNTGIEIANGEYVHFLDGDDYVDSTFEEKMYQKAKSNNCDMVFCRFDQTLPDEKLLHSFDKFFRSHILKKLTIEPYKGHFVLKQYLKSKLYIWTGSAIYRREFLLYNNLRYTPGCAYGEDVEFIVKAILMSKSIMFIPDLLAFYVLRESSTTQTVTRTITSRFENLHGVYERVYSFIDSSTNDKNLLKLWQGKIGLNLLTLLKTAVVLGEHIDLNDELLACLCIAGKANSEALDDVILKGMLNVLPQEFVMKVLYWYGSLRRKSNG